MKNWFFILPLLICLFTAQKQSVFAAKLDSIQIVIDQNQLILPGETFKIGIIGYQRNGKIRKTFGMPGGSTWWWKYKVDVVGGTYFSGKIAVNEQLKPSIGKYISIEAYPRRQPNLKRKVLVPLNYETNIVFQPSTAFDKAPGCRFKGEVTSLFNNEVAHVYNKLNRRKGAENFLFIAQGGYWNNGQFTIYPDFRNINNHCVSLIVNSQTNRAVSDTFSILLDYKHNYRLDLCGQSGYSGFNGSDGSDGSKGYHGADGEHGGNGEYGENGPDIGVWVDLYHDSILNVPLLYVYAENIWTGREYRYLINTDGGQLSVSSTGGRGGDGGNGGDGGDGGNGHDGEVWFEKRKEKRIVSKPFKEKRTIKETKTITNSEGKQEEVEVEKEIEVIVYKDVEEEFEIEIRCQNPGENGGDGGWGGAGGFAGGGGDGGHIALFFTDDARPYQNLITASSNGGSGGKNGNGGDGGSGGKGGNGNPNGYNGRSGGNGPDQFGWADDGWDRGVEVGSTDEFFFYTPSE